METIKVRGRNNKHNNKEGYKIFQNFEIKIKPQDQNKDNHNKLNTRIFFIEKEHTNYALFSRINCTKRSNTLKNIY